MTPAFLVLESGEFYKGIWHGGKETAGEIVFNTSHSGYEEIATDPSYYNQVVVLTAPMQGNYGASHEVWESRQLQISGFVCLEIQNSQRDQVWKNRLLEYKIPLVSELDTRKLVIQLRQQGTLWGALLSSHSYEEAKEKADQLIEAKKKQSKDWVYKVSCREPYEKQGQCSSGPRVALLDLGCKANIIRELEKRSQSLKVFPCRTKPQEIRAYQPDFLFLSNGPGDPAEVQSVVDHLKEMLGEFPIFGICMGHQLLSLALGAKTYALRFGHRASNHPVKDLRHSRIYITSQNHGYAVEEASLPKGVEVSHRNLNDGTVSGLFCPEKKCMSVQFHPESHPGPHDAEVWFDEILREFI